jgi:hypothetical protein
MTTCARVAARFAATRSIEARFGETMLQRLRLTLTAMPTEGCSTTSADRSAVAATRPSDAAESDTQRAPAR